MKKLRVGILGLRRGMTHVHNFAAREDVQIVGVADRLDWAREQAAAVVAPHEAQLMSDYEELLALKPDAVVIATNGKLQVEHACQALAAGCHVLSEVPGAYTQEEVIRLRDAVEHSGLVYMFAENLSFMDFIRYWRKWILEGRFGPISLAEAEYIHYLPATLQTADGTRMMPSEAGGRSDVAPIWRADQPPIQYLTHDLGPLLEVIDDRCVSVTCRSGPWFCKETPLRSDGQFALFETANGTLIRILVTLSTRRPGEHRFRLFGTEGGAEWFSYEGVCRRFDGTREERDGWERVDIGLAARDDDTSTGHGGTDSKVAENFVRCILEGRPSPIDVYRMTDYTLPGIIANDSALLGGAPLPIPNLHRGPFTGSKLWDAVGLPDTEPVGEPYRPPRKDDSVQ